MCQDKIVTDVTVFRSMIREIEECEKNTCKDSIAVRDSIIASLRNTIFMQNELALKMSFSTLQNQRIMGDCNDEVIILNYKVEKQKKVNRILYIMGGLLVAGLIFKSIEL